MRRANDVVYFPDAVFIYKIYLNIYLRYPKLFKNGRDGFVRSDLHFRIHGHSLGNVLRTEDRICSGFRRAACL